MKVILWAAILCLGVFPAGCSDESDHDFAPAPDGFEISMDLSSSTIYRGQSTTLTLEIANYGPDIELDFACHDHFGFRIKDQFWSQAHPVASVAWQWEFWSRPDIRLQLSVAKLKVGNSSRHWVPPR